MKDETDEVFFCRQVAQSELDLDLVKTILGEYKIHNADVTLREDVTAEDLIDVVEGNRVYIPCLYLLNKIDQISIEVQKNSELENHTISLRTRGQNCVICNVHSALRLEHVFCFFQELDIIYKIPHCVPISAHHKWNFDDLLEKMWDYLALIRMYV